MTAEPGRLHLVAKDMLAQADANAEATPWLPEYLQWIINLIGPQPTPELGKRGHENWNLVALGGLLAWGYFAEVLNDAERVADGNQPTDVHDSGVTGDSVVPGEGVAPAEEPAPDLRVPFAVLGPDGQPVVEGLK